MCSGSEAGTYLRLIDSCITQLKAQGPSRTCNESEEEHLAVECRDEDEAVWREDWRRRCLPTRGGEGVVTQLI